MKTTKLSLVAVLAMSSAFAGGDIAPVEPVVEVAPVAVTSATTINGKLTGYYITDDLTDDMFGDHAQLAFGATLDVTHTFNNWLTANFSALGYTNTFKSSDTTYFDNGYFENEGFQGGIFNVANLTATFGDTTFVGGRQLLGTPMLQGYDWLLAPGSFEAYTLMNNSIENLTLVGSYVYRHRANNSGEFGTELDGDNYAFGAMYDNETITANLWYYNVDAAAYTQVYADAGYNLGMFKVEGQYVMTDFDTATDSDAFGLMASTSISGFDLMAGYNFLRDNGTGYVGWNALYTNQWNSSVADQFKDKNFNAFKVGASTTMMGVSADVSYADYENDRYEANLILGYDINEAIDAGIVYSNYQTTVSDDETDNQFELYANYKF